MRTLSKYQRELLIGFIILTMIFIVLYVTIRITLFIVADFPWYEKTLALILLCAEIFTIVHSFGYILNILNVVTQTPGPKQGPPALTEYPPVAVVLCSYKEPLDVIEKSLTCFYHLKYPNKQLYLLDDTRYDKWTGSEPAEEYKKKVEDLCKFLGVNVFRHEWRGAKAGMINDFVDYQYGTPQNGSYVIHNQAEAITERPKYIVVFDADMNPFPSFVNTVTGYMEKYPKMSFLQTPQYYSNFEYNRVARAAGLLQVIFYEYICEGKEISDAMFCCGTNVILRMEALREVGGFDETSVTEDFATSYRFHTHGWTSGYINNVLCFGMGPEDLGAFFKQQFRWSLGNITLFRRILVNFFKNPFKLSIVKWWEYLLSGSHYFVGFVFFIMMMCPILYLFMDIPSYFAKPQIYFLFFTPYLVLSLTTFFWSLVQRRYKFMDLFSGIFIIGVTFPVYMKSALQGMLGYPGSFVVTPKKGSSALSLWELWPQVLCCMLCFIAFSWGIMRLIYEREPFWGIIMNMFWVLYSGITLTTLMYFNHPLEESKLQ